MEELNKNKARKDIGVISIICVVLAGLLGLALLFKIVEFNGIVENLLISLLIIVVSNLLILNAIDAMMNKNALGIVTVIMIVLSALCFLILAWEDGAFGDVYLTAMKITGVVALISLFLDVFVSNFLAVGKSLLAVQIIFYILLGYIEFVICLAFFENTELLKEPFTEMFIAFIIIAITLFAIIKIKGRSIRDKKTETGKTITISLSEYNGYKEKIANLEEEINKLKGEKQ